MRPVLRNGRADSRIAQTIAPSIAVNKKLAGFSVDV
jgi:hypothetical protein